MPSLLGACATRLSIDKNIHASCVVLFRTAAPWAPPERCHWAGAPRDGSAALARPWGTSLWECCCRWQIVPHYRGQSEGDTTHHDCIDVSKAIIGIGEQLIYWE
eukprot:7279408-Pyramimonas_sp.AAC.1